MSNNDAPDDPRGALPPGVTLEQLVRLPIVQEAIRTDPKTRAAYEGLRQFGAPPIEVATPEQFATPPCYLCRHYRPGRGRELLQRGRLAEAMARESRFPLMFFSRFGAATNKRDLVGAIPQPTRNGIIKPKRDIPPEVVEDVMDTFGGCAKSVASLVHPFYTCHRWQEKELGVMRWFRRTRVALGIEPTPEGKIISIVDRRTGTELALTDPPP